jgi:hypothetical protein
LIRRWQLLIWSHIDVYKQNTKGLMGPWYIVIEVPRNFLRNIYIRRFIS